jgi:pyruvate dehydrogenase E2 component (dihydrolipoyllysine-residue acetyltransferase)
MGLFRMPSLGADMEAGTLVEWLKKAGDRVASGDIIAVVETQKGAIEIETFESGVIERLMTNVGQTVPVGTPLAMIRAEGEKIVTEPMPAKAVPAPAAPPEAAPTLPPVVAPLAGAAMKASPAARKLAAEHGLDLSAIEGSGPEGAVVFVDVEAALRRAVPAGPAPGVGAAPEPQRPAGVEGMRAAIAAAMARSKREIPHYYLGHAADITACLDWLAARNADRAPADRLLFGALLLKAVAKALGQFPEFNGFYRSGRFEPAKAIHVGMAVALRGGGLIAPAIHDTDRLPLDRLMAQMRDLANRVRAGRFRSSEMADPTVTLTSLGERGADWVMPVIYPPQVAILGAGSPASEPWVVEERVVPRQICHLTLAADHRVSDGHRGALLLRAIADLLRMPEQL